MSFRVIGIDPGTFESGFLVWEDGVIEAATIPNLELRARLKENNFGGAKLVGIEMVASYGMPVGKETFETVRWIGRFEECSIPPVRLVYRKDVKIHLCGTVKAKDGTIRQALIDKYGAPGTMKARGKTYGISGHLWSALAIADFVSNGVIVPGVKPGNIEAEPVEAGLFPT